MTEYEWEAVCSLWGIRLTAAQQAAGCPDAFEPCNLAIMQRPAIRTSPDRGAELKSQRDILAKIEAAIAAGTLHASIQTRTVPVTKTVTVPDLTAPRRNWVTDWEFSDFRPPMVQKPVKTGEREEGYKVIDRAAFRDWLNARGEPPSVHIQAWIRALDLAPAAITKAKGQAAVVKCFLQECVTRAQRLGFEFDLNNMPGQKEQFLELIKNLSVISR